MFSGVIEVDIDDKVYEIRVEEKHTGG